jgi:type II secretory pathway component PulJ
MGRARRRIQAFTLIEGVFSMFLIFLVLSSLTYTLSQAGKVKSNLKNMGELSEVVQVMSMLKADIGASLRILAPSEGGSSSELSLARIDPALPITARIDDEDDLDPFGPNEEAQVRYFVDNGLLKRRIVSANGFETVERLLEAENFQAQREPASDTVILTFDVKNTRRSRQHLLKVSLR